MMMMMMKFIDFYCVDEICWNTLEAYRAECVEWNGEGREIYSEMHVKLGNERVQKWEEWTHHHLGLVLHNKIYPHIYIYTHTHEEIDGKEGRKVD